LTRALPEVLATLAHPKLLVVGDLILDRYFTGAAERISPEAPIPILRVESSRVGLGGAGFVAQNITVLGAHATLLGVTGDDESGARIVEVAASLGVTVKAIAEPGRRTSVKTRHMAHSHTTAQQVLRVDEETTAPISASTEAALLDAAKALIPEVDAVLLSDYVKGCLTQGLLDAVFAAAKENGTPVLVDSKRPDYARFRGATAITPNRPETQRVTGVHVETLADADAAAARLIDDLGLSFVLITLDREGMYLKQRDEPGVHLPTSPREVFDVSGAGDMVLSVLACALASGATPHEASALANVAAGLAVERVGAVPVTREEIGARLANDGEGAGTKHVDRAEVGAVIGRHRAARRRVVFTNGCFDILHAGHIRFLKAARAEGDVLVVGLNSDDSVRRIKGEERPVNSVDDRIEVLAALSMVDYVIVFDEDTPANIIAQVEPDVLVKGVDWKDKGVVGRELVEGRGGKVVLVELHEGRSTTRIVQKIKGAQ